MAATAYSVLGVEPTATQEQLRQAFRAKVLKHHPDRGGDPAKASQINRAWQRVGTPEERAKYDRKLEGLARAQAPAHAPPAPGRRVDPQTTLDAVIKAAEEAGVDKDVAARAKAMGGKTTDVVKAGVELIGLFKQFGGA